MPKLYVLEGPMKGQTFRFDGDTVFLGRSPKNDIQIHDSTLSRKQLKIFRIGKKYFVEDLKSTNGTIINGELIPAGEGFGIVEGDTVSMGHTVIRVGGIPEEEMLAKDYLKVSASDPKANRGDRPRKERRLRTSKDRELMYKLTELLRHPMEVNIFFQRVLELLLKTLPRIDRAVVLLTNGNESEIKETIFRTREPQEENAKLYSRKVVDRVLKERKPIRMSDTTYESPEDFSVSGDTLEIRSILCVPMIIEAEIKGVIYVDSLRGPYGFRKEDTLLLNSLSGPLALAIEKARLASKMARYNERKDAK